MLKKLKKYFFEIPSGGLSKDDSTNSRKIYVATCALFLEMAKIDGEFSRTEEKNILSILVKNYNFSYKHAQEIAAAAEKQLNESIQLWEFTNLINENFSREDKMKIIELIWKIIYLDGKLDKHEDYLVHKLARLLNLSHRELIDAKLKILRGEIE
jgi:uncharacterized tellurite resistance protein B-like protein